MKAALLTALNQPLEIADVHTNGLRYGQVLVKVAVAGICGAQLQEIRGDKASGPLPHPLGHEGCGFVLEIGPGVTTVNVGDKVLMHWRKGEGVEAETPVYDYAKITQYATSGIQEIHKITAGKVTTWQELAIVSENRLTKVPNDVPNDLCALLGCSLSTALATVENEAKIRFGESVLIVGCGGLGACLILAAKLAGAGTIVAVDSFDNKQDIAESLGATFARSNEFYKFSPAGYDIIIDTSGSISAIELSLQLLAPSGRYILVGQPKGHLNFKVLNALHLFDGGKTIKATQGGGFNPIRDIPRYVNLWRSGRLDYEKLITHRVSLDEINSGLDLVRNGQAGRVLVDI